MKIRTAYGNVIRRVRSDRGLSVRQASGKAHVSLSFWCEVENGKKDASSEYLGAILTSLEISPVEFFMRVAHEYRRPQPQQAHAA